ncbi:MAG: N-acetyltransferase [Actinobacteria bacterium HGW-Actinobacteria-1]|jgi:phosphinothricin acetyltransferase|nr:MAG: N-acetyltransferase [Actinobacteria bacterium HGW-Actinobacteria-1]
MRPDRGDNVSVTVRAAVPADAAAIASIYNHAVEHTTATFDTQRKTVEDRTAWLAGRARQHPVIVAEEDGAVVGWGAFSPWSDRCSYASTVEMSVYIDPEHVRRGLGGALSRELLRLAPEVGVHNILSRICSENAASLAMATRLGFDTIGTMHEVGRKFDRWLDVVMLEYIVALPDRV